MTNIQVKNVEPELHQALRERAAAEGRSISEHLLELIRRDLRRPQRAGWLDRAQKLNATGRSSAENLAIRDAGRGRA
jgi:antitoxin FitA